jgi:cell fate (sporulation/competence/biofilm development) regulator YlbF (YheA/YmcA/DUF963 family)
MNEKLKEKFEEFLALLEADSDIIEYRAAKEAYENDKTVISKINEYNVQTSILEQESAKEQKDTLLIENIKKRINELYSEITEKEVMKRMTAAEDKLSMIFSEINMGLQSVINPEGMCHDEGCGGGCSTCGGCH